MDPWQVKRQLAFLLAALAWVDAPGNPVFTGGAFVSEDLEGNFATGNVAPDGPVPASLAFARVSCLPYELDPEGAGRIEDLRLLLFATNGGWSTVISGGSTSATGFDTHGINQVTGALRATSQGQGKTLGRDVDEILGRFLEALVPAGQFVDSTHGFQGRATRAEAPVPVDGVQVLTRPLEVQVTNATTSRFYHAPRRLTAVLGATLDLAWTNPPARFDTVGRVVVRKAGATAPTKADGTDGTVLATLAAAATTYSDAPGTGTWSYGVFGAYDETHSPPATPDRYSAPATATVAVP